MDTNKTALITGATKGMGRAIAVVLAKAGFDLALCARNLDDLEELREQLLAAHTGNRVIVHSVDFADPEQLEPLVHWYEAQWGALDVLVNNVGVFYPAGILDEAPDLLQQHMQINVYTPHYLARFFGKKMRNAKRGHIINITSIASRTPVASAGSYTVTKYALAGLTQVLREELRPYGVKVSEIVPGSTWTSSWEGSDLPKQQFVQPEDVAAAVMASLQSSAGASLDEMVLTPLKKF